MRQDILSVHAIGWTGDVASVDFAPSVGVMNATSECGENRAKIRKREDVTKIRGSQGARSSPTD